MSERPIGAFLSGGLDSSLVVAILKQYRDDIPTFTIGLEGSPDIAAAQEVVNYLDLKHHNTVTYTVAEGIAAIPEVIRSLESYDITTVRASTPQWLLSKWIKENTEVRVLLSGECIDEICGYFFLKFCKSEEDFMEKTRDMLKELHLYDLLRTDRTTASHSLEVRVPFASKDFLKYIMNINPKEKMFANKKMEKMLLRDAFKGYLPDSVLYRKKHAFSDSVSSNKVSWYQSVVTHAKNVIDSSRYAKRAELYPQNTPHDEESFWYREIFSEYYPEQHNLTPSYWMPKIDGVKITNPSATILEGFSET